MARAAPPADQLRRALYRRVTALARLECAREARDAPRRAAIAAVKDRKREPRSVEALRREAQDLAPRLWPVELSQLATLDFSARAALALVAIEHLTHQEAGAILELPEARLLALLAVARQKLARPTPGAPRRHLRLIAAGEVAPSELLNYVDGELGAAQRDRIAAFLDASPARAQDCARWRQLDETLRQAFGPLLRAPPPRALEDAFRARENKGGLLARIGARLARFFAPRAGKNGIASRPL